MKTGTVLITIMPVASPSALLRAGGTLGSGIPFRSDFKGIPSTSGVAIGRPSAGAGGSVALTLATPFGGVPPKFLLARFDRLSVRLPGDFSKPDFECD